MTKQPAKHSKSFKEGIATLTEEVSLALKWNRPSILLVVHNSKIGREEAQRSLEREIKKNAGKVAYIRVESEAPDVILSMAEMSSSENTVFFISGIENADRASDGRVHRALNIRREVLVEKHICAVFWLNEFEAENLARLAPDFWAFRHRVVEFAPKRGSKKQTVPAGLFLWKEQAELIENDSVKKEIAYYENFLTQMPMEESAAATRAEALLKLAHYSWLLNDLEKFQTCLTRVFELLEKYPIPEYRAWAHNAKGIGLHEEGNKKDADIQFTQALSYDAKNSVVIFNSAIAMHGLGKNRDAILMSKRAIKHNPNNARLRRALGYLFLSAGKTENAIECMLKTQAIDPENAVIGYSLAVCYFKNDQPVECIKEISKAEEIAPPQNSIQQAVVEILNNKADKALTRLKYSLEKGEVSKHNILRDPNLHFLMNTQEFTTSGQ